MIREWGWRALLAAPFTLFGPDGGGGAQVQSAQQRDPQSLGDENISALDPSAEELKLARQAIESTVRELSVLLARDRIPPNAMSAIAQIRRQVLVYQKLQGDYRGADVESQEPVVRIEPQIAAPSSQAPKPPSDATSLQERQDRLSETHLAPSLREMTRRAQRAQESETAASTAQMLEQLNALEAAIQTKQQLDVDIEDAFQHLEILIQRL